MSNSIEPTRQPVSQPKDERPDGGNDRLRRRFEAAFEAAVGLPAVAPGADGFADGRGRLAGLAAEAAGRRATEAARAETGPNATLRAQPADLHALLRRLPEEELHLRLAHGLLAGLEIRLRRRGDHLTVRLKHDDRARAPQVEQLGGQLAVMLGALLGSANVDVLAGDAYVAPTR